MLTRRGWTVGIVAVVLVGAGRFFGIAELIVLGVAAIGLVTLATAWTRTRRIRLRVQRSVQPVRVHAGGVARVELTVTNLGAPTPVVKMTDPVTGTLGARLLISPLGPAEQVTASYLLPTERRGRLVIGPAEVAVVDPLGVARTSIGVSSPTTLVVYPATQSLLPPRLFRGPEPLGIAADAHTLQRIGEDFYALRDYTVGDDLRRIHWPSTARLGRPMVREDEVPRRSRVTVVLDTRSSSYDEERFELAVSCAASVVLASATRRDPLRLLTIAGTDTGFVTSGEGLAQVFDHLAEVTTSGLGSLRRVIAEATAATSGAVVVVLSGGPFELSRDLELVAAAARGSSTLTVIRVCPVDGATGRPQGFSNRYVEIASLSQLAASWASAQAEGVRA